MSVQFFPQVNLLETDQFLFAPADTDADQVFTGRSQWITLLSEVLPRALLAELGLSRILLGSSGGGQFLLVLPGEALQSAESFLLAATRQISQMSSGIVPLVWAVTDNLGDWAVIRKRLNDQLEGKRNG